MRRRVLCAVPFLVALLAAPALAVCPQSKMSPGGITVFSTLPVDGRSSGSSSVSYNIPVGTLQANSSCSSSPECSGSASLYVEDDFTLTGPPPGTLVSLTANFRVSLDGFFSGGQGVSGTAILADDQGHSVTVNGPKFQFNVTLPIQVSSGTPFRLHFELRATNLGPGSAHSDGAFSFVGVPANSTVSSCQGYTTGGTVAARESSWGRVKILYR